MCTSYGSNAAQTMDPWHRWIVAALKSSLLFQQMYCCQGNRETDVSLEYFGSVLVSLSSTGKAN